MKQLSILLLLLLVSIGLFAQAETEPNNTWDATGVLTIIDGDYTGNIPAGDHDYWKFWSVTGDQLDINCLNGALLLILIYIFMTQQGHSNLLRMMMQVELFSRRCYGQHQQQVGTT